MNKTIIKKEKKDEIKEDEIKTIEISQEFLKEYKELVKKYHRDFNTQIVIVKVEKL